MVVEILSPSTAREDKIRKLNKYRDAGVREYWIVDPVHELVDVLFWEQSPVAKTYGFDEKIAVQIFGDCEIDLASVSANDSEWDMG